MDRASAQGLSTTEYCVRLPKRRRSHESKGKLLWFPRTDLVMVPYEQRGAGWACAVVVGNEVYPPDGYSLSVPDVEIETAIEVRFSANLSLLRGAWLMAESARRGKARV